MKVCAINRHLRQAAKRTRRIEKKISLFKGKIKILEERYVEDKIEKELYIKYKSK